MSEGFERERGRIRCFEDLFTWQKSVEFAKAIYIVTERSGLKSDFGLKDQMRRSAVSLSTNIAEGFERRSDKEYLNFLNIAKGSAGEIRSLLVVAFEVGYIAQPEPKTMVEKAKFLSGSIANQMRSIAASSK